MIKVSSAEHGAEDHRQRDSGLRRRRRFGMKPVLRRTMQASARCALRTARMKFTIAPSRALSFAIFERSASNLNARNGKEHGSGCEGRR